MPTDGPAETVRVATPAGGYDVRAGAGVLDELPGRLAALAPTETLLVTDAHVDARWGGRARDLLAAAGTPFAVAALPPGEATKALATLETLAEAARAARLDRGGAVLAFGGGVIGDVAGFFAATWLRGVAFAQLPTTLLAQVDSSVGGKTGVNLPAGKNLLGAFYPPRFVLADTALLASLPPRERANGLAEAVKHGLLGDAAYFAWLEENARPLLAGDGAALARLVAGSCRLKAAVVGRDEREAGERALLNLGHTFAHAYEAASGLTLPHGAAVAMGLVAACRLGERTAGLDPAVTARTRRLLRVLDLPTEPPARDGAFAPEALLERMRGDKKTLGGTLRFVVPEAVGRARVAALADPAPALEAMRAPDRRSASATS